MRVAAALMTTAMREIGRDTDALTEAFTLALKNGFMFIDWDRSEAARRALGCLYGLTSDGNNTFPKVPSAVTVASIMQNLLSAVLIFLLLLGIRNFAEAQVRGRPSCRQ